MLEAVEIHRWHPKHNRGPCALCYAGTTRHPLYSYWRGLRFWYADRVCTQWQDLKIFAADIETLGPRPRAAHLQLIDPSGLFEPGNVFWGRAGPYPRLDKQKP